MHLISGENFRWIYGASRRRKQPRVIPLKTGDDHAKNIQPHQSAMKFPVSRHSPLLEPTRSNYK